MSAILWTVIRVLALGSALVLLPLGAGYVFFHRGEFDRGLIYLFGVCAVLALFEVVYLPFFVIGRTLSAMTAVYFVLVTAAAMLGFFLNSRHPKPPVERRALSKREKVFLLAAVLVAAWQIARTTFGAGTWNIDDAWYLGLANTALYTDDIMRTDPTTGFPYNYFEHMGEYLTYVFSPWPLYLAIFSRLFSLPVLVLARTVLPGFFIVLFYYVVYRLALFFFRGAREKALPMDGQGLGVEHRLPVRAFFFPPFWGWAWCAAPPRAVARDISCQRCGVHGRVEQRGGVADAAGLLGACLPHPHARLGRNMEACALRHAEPRPDGRALHAVRGG